MKYRVDTRELQKLMIDKNVKSIIDLAKLTGINRNTLAGVVTGREYPSSTTMCKIVDVLDIEPSNIGKIFLLQNLRKRNVRRCIARKE